MDYFAGLDISSVRNGSPNAEPSRKTPPLRVPPILDVAQAQGEPDVEPYCLLNDLRRKTIAAIADFLHPLDYWAAEGAASLKRRDNALAHAMKRADAKLSS
jgi:hypothetical protein